jgi:hypothetical protein
MAGEMCWAADLNARIQRIGFSLQSITPSLSTTVRRIRLGQRLSPSWKSAAPFAKLDFDGREGPLTAVRALEMYFPL